MADRLRAYPWSHTPLGLEHAWPQPLKTLVDLMLSAKQAMFIAWGPDRTLLYNDAYAEVLASKHPQALGRDFLDVWSEIRDDLLPMVEKAYGGEPVHMADITLVIHRRGYPEETHFSFSYTPVRDEAGQVAGFFCPCNDITGQVMAERSRRSSEDALRDSETRLRGVLDAVTEGFVLLDREFRVIEINPEGMRIDTRPRGEIIGRSHWDVWPGTEDSVLGRLYQRAMAERVPIAIEHRYVWPDGRDAWMDVRGYPSGDGLALFYRDISERKRFEEALRAAAEQLRLATDAAEVGLWDVDPVTDALFWPPRVKAMFGISAEKPVSMADFFAGLHPDDREATAAAYASATDPGRRAVYDVEYRTIGKEDGVVRWVAARGRGLFDEQGRCVRVLGTAIDITERRAQQEAAESSRRLLDAVLDAMPVGVVIADASGAITRTNPANTLLWGETPASGSVDEYREWVGYWPESGKRVAPHEWAMARALERAETCPGELVEIERFGTRERRFMLNSGAPVHDAQGRVVAALVAQLDVTDRVKAERALQALNDTLEHQVAERTVERDRVWRNSRDLLVVLGPDGVFRAVNPAWTVILGHRAGEVAGRSFLDFVWPDDADLTRSGLNDATASRDLTSFENRCAHKDGTPRWISWYTSVEGDLVYAYGRDVTAEKEQAVALEQAQEALRQSQKMEAVGQLTGGIAHDFNNMLAVIVGSLDLLGRRIGPGDARAKRYVDAATEGARRAALLTQRLLAFSRQQPLRPEAIDANKLVAGMSELLRGSLGSNVRLETVLASGLWRTHADPNQLENVLLNLAVNARDAMPGGGRLTIETANCHLDARYVAQHIGVPAGQYVMVAVTDTGSGMPAEVIAKAFDPFFTTKAVGKGTGLGLSQVYGFVKQSGGHVKIYSEPGQGTAVKVYLPRLVGGEAEAPRDQDASGVPLGEWTEVVLVVEDEPAVRQFSVDALTELGYRALEADGAAAALRLLDQHPEIALLFTDIVMPDVNGAKLAEAARRRRPGLKVLFTTGYTRNAVVHNGVLDPGVELIGKPFTIEELAAKVREVLDAPLDVTPT